MATQLPLLDARAGVQTGRVQTGATQRARGGAASGAAASGATRHPGPAAVRTAAGARTSSARLPDPLRDPVYWRLDDHTREVGLRGVAEARRALAAAVQRSSTAA